MEFKTIRFYVVIALLIVGYFAYARYTGLVYWESRVEKNTDNSNSHTSSGGRRFYHK
ncbi:hypothetical protein [Mucilaginibacter defluvii]|uniref:Uncharacterized protein n=1 Tax=Mucilaginibacter defluvii TaxID=1196019 RepID=A0ABP9G1L3_9SPHI